MTKTIDDLPDYLSGAIKAIYEDETMSKEELTAHLVEKIDRYGDESWKEGHREGHDEGFSAGQNNILEAFKQKCSELEDEINE